MNATVKHFDAWQHLVIMLYAAIKRFDSLRETTGPMFPDARKLVHPGVIPSCRSCRKGVKRNVGLGVRKGNRLSLKRR